ncbi:hypothetical protein PHAVU_001G224500 [Phaseolus vulgaris]
MSLRPGSSSGSSWKARKKSYKTGINAEDSRRRRVEDLVSIRKIKRQTTLLNKREEKHSCDTVSEAVPEIVKRLYQAPPVDEVVKNGILPRFVELLSRDDAPQLQIEVLWILSNFASGTSQHKSAVVELGVIPILVNLLSSTDGDTREEAVCLLGNIVADSPDHRDLALNHGALKPLLCQLQPHSTLYMLRNATWCLSVLFLGMPPVNFEQVKIALPALQQLVHATDEEVLTDTCWALAYLSEGQIGKSQAIVELGVCPRLVQLLQHPSHSVIIPALQALGNIAAGDEAQAQFLIDNQLLPCLHQLLTREYTKSIFKEACWTIANITAGTRAQIQAVFDANIIPPLVQILHTAEFEVKREAVCAIYNVTSKGSYDNVRSLAAVGCIEAVCELLTCPDPKMVTLCLEGLVNILAVGEADKDENGNIFAKRVEECGGLEKIETLQIHDNNEVHTRALWISDLFRAENELEDTDMCVSLLDFSLGVNKPKSSSSSSSSYMR